MKLKSALIIWIVAALPGVAIAQAGDTASTPRIDKRQERQETRIEKGVQSGALNDKEAKRLEKGQQRVQKMEDKAVTDGKVTKKEKKHIEHAQDQQSKKIYREKHDKQTAPK